MSVLLFRGLSNILKLSPARLSFISYNFHTPKNLIRFSLYFLDQAYVLLTCSIKKIYKFRFRLVLYLKNDGSQAKKLVKTNL